MEAWTALIDRYSGLIYGTAWQFNLPPEDVADVYQSVTVALLEGLSELREPDKFNSWLTTVTVHECFRVKRRRTRSLASLEDMKEEVSNIPDHSALPDELVQRDENRQLVRQALAMMEEPCRSLLTHLFYEKELWTYEQIANEYGVSVSTIGPKRSRCLKKLLQNLKTLGM